MEIITSLGLGVAIGLIAGIIITLSKRKEVQGKVFFEMAKNLVNDVVKQLEKQERLMLEQGVRLDIMELRLGKLEGSSAKIEASKPRGEQLLKQNDVMKFKMREYHITKVEKKAKGGKQGLNLTEFQALKLLKSGALTPRDIQRELGRSREHTARLLKGLYDKGYVMRDESKKPYVYKLTEKGIKVVKAE
jgi:DNA-binding MarR family transcriptional regulator